MAEYRYGMRLRGYAPMCQPMDGLVGRMPSRDNRYYDYLDYNRKLPEKEMANYELDFLTEIEEKYICVNHCNSPQFFGSWEECEKYVDYYYGMSSVTLSIVSEDDFYGYDEEYERF